MKNDAHEFSMDFEFKGAKAHMKLAKKSKNLISKNLFYSLAMQEVEHAKKIDEFFSNRGSSKKPILQSVLPNIETVMKELFGSMEAKTKRESPDSASIYGNAIKLEKKGYDTYKEFHDKSFDPNEKAFFKFLMEEENKHIESLANVAYYLTNTGDWLEEDESRTWNWMNL